LFPHRSVRNNVNYGLPRGADRDRRTLDALRLVGLDEKVDRMPGTLSGGEQQRVALARALAPNPGVMLLDEPFSSLDAALRVHLREDVRRLLTSLAITAVLVTHDQQEALAFGDRVGVMRAGVLQQIGAPEDIYARPASPWVARFVGEATLLPAQLEGTTAETALGRVATLPSAVGAGTAMLRPEQITIVDGTQARVHGVEYVGAATRYEIVLDAGQRVLATAPGPPTRRAGDLVDLDVTGALAHTWPGPLPNP
jgi:iron(III) transport system ATP-binding protein